tara:strand:+ start:279 stop:2471 length:2193 start_codon:yes stop_codon:yes gene_type:complete
MTKIFSKIILTILFLIISFTAYLSLIGFETKSFNDQIKENIKKIDKNFDVELNDVKIVLDLFNLNINAKTLGPTISYNNRLIDIELIKSNISLLNVLNKEFSISNLFISTKSVKLKDIASFLRVISKKNKTELYILENFISKGYFIADLSLNFDDQGKIKDDLKINGLVKDGSIKLLNEKKIGNIDFIFEMQNKNLNIKDLKFSYEKINFTSTKIRFLDEDKFVNISGKIGNNEVSLSEKALKNLINPFSNIDLKSLKFSSENEFVFQINEKFKISNYEIKSLLNIKELSVKNNFDIKNIFPNSQSEIIFKNQQAKIFFDKTKTMINGNGEFLIQEDFDKVSYVIEKNKQKYLFDIKFDLAHNPINIDFLNYKTNKQSKPSISINGKFIEGKSLELKEVKFKNDSDIIDFRDLKFNNEFKISAIRSAKFNYIDLQNKKNVFQVKGDKKDLFISGKVYNASKLIEDLIFKDTENKNFFLKDHNLTIDLKEVYLHNNYMVYSLTGNLKVIDDIIYNANISSQFNNNDKIIFTITSNDDQKVTTLFSDQAEPFVKKFDFIKGFDKGSLDFYSVKSKDITNSKLKIYDFKLKELPALTKILTLASLQGIADLLSGEGIGFSEFEMNFDNKDNLMTIKEIYAIGPAISILMDGYIEKSKLVSLRGTLVPATTINKVIGSIPIIGDILVGKKTGEGVFGVSFKIKGHPKNLETSVNPIKTLTPRFITRTLEKIKKN